MEPGDIIWTQNPITAFEAREERPTSDLRWKDGVLEQRFQMMLWRGGAAYPDGSEWRPVPQADED